MVSMIAPVRNLVRQSSKRFLKSRKTSESKTGLGVRRLSTNFWNEVQQETETHQEDHTSTTLGEINKELSMNDDASKSDARGSEKKHEEEDEKKCEIQSEDTTQEDAQTTLSEEFQRAIPQAQDDNTFVTDDDCSSIFDSMSLHSGSDDGSLGIHDGDDNEEDQTECSFQFDMGPVLAQSRPRPSMVRLRGSKNVSSLGNDFVHEERNRLKTKIRQSIDAMTEEETVIRKALRSHLDKAKARHDNDNIKGALLSMQKAHKIHEDQESLLAAIGSLRLLESQVEKPKKSLISSRKGGSLEISVDSSGSLDLVHQKEHFDRIMKDHQTHESRHTTLTDKQLLQKLIKLTERTELMLSGHSGHSARSLGASSSLREPRRFLKRGSTQHQGDHVADDCDDHSFCSLDI